MRWWARSLDPDDSIAALATDKVMQILRRIDEISGLIPEKPLITIDQRSINMGEVTFSIEDASANYNGATGDLSEAESLPETTEGDLFP